MGMARPLSAAICFEAVQIERGGQIDPLPNRHRAIDAKVIEISLGECGELGHESVTPGCAGVLARRPERPFVLETDSVSRGEGPSHPRAQTYFTGFRPI